MELAPRIFGLPMVTPRNVTNVASFCAITSGGARGACRAAGIVALGVPRSASDMCLDRFDATDIVETGDCWAGLNSGAFMSAFDCLTESAKVSGLPNSASPPMWLKYLRNTQYMEKR